MKIFKSVAIATVTSALLASFAFGCDCCETTQTVTNTCPTTTTSTCPVQETATTNMCEEQTTTNCPTEETTTCATQTQKNDCPTKVIDAEFDTPVNNIWSTIPSFGNTTRCCGDLEFCGC